MRRRFEYKDRELEDFLIRFYPAGNYTWIVPEGCFSVAALPAVEVVIPRPSNLITKAGKTEKLLL